MLKRSHTPFGHTLGRSTGWVHRAELARNGVKMLKGVEYKRIDSYGLHIALDGVDAVVPFDTIVVCVGQEPQRALVAALEALGRAPHLIGGAREAGELDAKRAMLEGAELAARL
jgi:2,4-dienoyl-CoA reductase (NADPH2)